jgi:lipopolysaccharide export system ATP-binding protein
MESLIEEFSLEHIRTNRGFLSVANAVKPKLHVVWQQIQNSYYWMNLLQVSILYVEDIQRIVAQLKNKNIGILITDHNVQNLGYY